MNYSLTPPPLARRIAFALSMMLLATMGPQLWSQESHVVTRYDGYLFVDGQYIQPPYDIRATDDRVTINGKEFAEDYFHLTNAEQHDATDPKRTGRGMGMNRRGARGQGRRDSRAFSPLAKIAYRLSQARMGAIVVLSRQESPFVMYPSRGGHQLLGALAQDADAELEAPVNLGQQDRATWNRLVSNFEPTDEFLTRVITDRQAAEQASLDVDRTTAANQMVAQISYPLTVFAMIVIAFGVGHLLSNQPLDDAQSGDPTTSKKAIVKTLSIIASLSIIDLVWTIAASSAGTMRELNPLGSHLIDDPTHLVVFKLAVTGVSVGILYALHHKRTAQVASWWCCLVLILLTARWVVFQSMFV